MADTKSEFDEQLHRDIEKLQKQVQELEACIAEHVKVEEALRSSEEKYRSLMDNLPGTVARINTNGTFIFVNKHFLYLSGLSRDEVIGHGP